MSEHFKWSFSADRCLRRCQRQFFLQHVAAWHNAREPLRREAFLLKQVKTLDLWQGSLVHRATELYVVPKLQEGGTVPWDRVIELTHDMARRQFEFSSRRRYREAGITKSAVGDDYCALIGHETPEGVADADYCSVIEVVERSLRNMSAMEALWQEIGGRDRYWPELQVRVTYDVAHIEAHIDLLYFREYGKPTVVDWKISESQGGGDADLQTALYGWALCRHPKWHVARAEDCELLEVQLLSKTILRHRADQATFDRLEDRIYGSLAKMQALGIGDEFNVENLDRFDFAPNPGSCVFCPMRSLCQKLTVEKPMETPAAAAPRSRRKTKERRNAPACPQLF